MRQWRNGDRRAGRALLSRYRRELLGYFVRRAPANAEDLTQAVLLACVEARDRIRDDEAFRYYAYGVAWRKLVRSSRARHDEPLPPEDALTGNDTDPEQSYARRQRHRVLSARVAELSPTTRRTVELYYFEQLRSREVAERLSVPHATARSRLVRGIEMLRRNLGLSAGDA